MQKAPLSHLDLTLRGLRSLFTSCLFWIVVLSFLLLVFDTENSSLFGMNPRERLAATLSFAPTHPLRLFGVTLLTYPLVHVNLSHWLSTALLLLFLGMPLQRRLHGKKRQLWQLILYGSVTIAVAMSFYLPIAPAQSNADRLLGLSALVWFQMGLLLFLKPPRTLWLLLPVMIYFSSSSLANWAHGFGFCLGLSAGLLMRFIFPRASAIFASRPSCPPKAKNS